MPKKWIPCNFDCLRCKRPDCDAPTGIRNGEMTKAIERAIKHTASEIEANIYRLEYEIAYYQKRKELAHMKKEKFEKLSPEEQQRVREKQKEYDRRHREKILKSKEYKRKAEAKAAREEALAEEQALEDAIQTVAGIPLPEDNVITKELAEQYRKKWIDAPIYAENAYIPPVENGETPQGETTPKTDTVKQVMDHIQIIDRFGRKMKVADICIRRSIITGEETVEVIITPN